MAVDKIVTKLSGGAMKLLRLTPAGTRLAKKIEDAVDPNAIRQAVARGKQYLQGKPSQAAQARARREGESLRSAVGAKPKPKPVRVPVGSTSKPKPKTSRGGTSAAARKPKGAPRSTITSAARQAAKRKPQKTSKPTTSRAGQMQNLANAQAQAAIGAAARRANPTAAVRPKVRAGGGGAGGKPPSKLAIGAGLGLVGAGIGAAALLAKKRAEKKGAPRSTLTSAASQAAKKVSKPSKKPFKTSLRAARAAGDLYYKDPETGRKMAAVFKSDLKPGQSLTQYINDKEGKTSRAGRPRSKPTPPKSTRG